MPHLYRADMYTDRYEFEVCDAAAGQCPHKAPQPEHRLYTWSKSRSKMSIADMLREVRALESARTAQAIAVEMPQKGQSI